MAFTVTSKSFKDGDYLGAEHILSADFGRLAEEENEVAEAPSVRMEGNTDGRHEAGEEEGNGRMAGRVDAQARGSEEGLELGAAARLQIVERHPDRLPDPVGGTGSHGVARRRIDVGHGHVVGRQCAKRRRRGNDVT